VTDSAGELQEKVGRGKERLMFRPDIPEQLNLADYFLDDRIREGKGDRVAIRTAEGGTFTYRQVQVLANKLAHVLRRSGAGAEDRVLICLPDSVEFAAAFFATLKNGSVVAMVNPELPAEDYEHYLAYTKAKVLVCDEALYQRARAQIDGGRHLRAVLRRRGGLEPLLDDAPSEFDNEPTSKDDLAIWLFTSGSTGKPKAAVHMHHDFMFNTECYAKRVLGLGEDDVTMGVPKLFFGYATGTNLMFPFAVGAQTVLFEDRPSPERLFELIAKFKPTVLTSVPTMIGKMLAAADEASPPDLSSLRVSVSAGEALPEELYRRWQERFRSEILDGIGSAELFHIYISNRIGDVKLGSLGRLVPGYEARVVDEDGRDVPDGELGRLWVKGDSAALCYWGAHEKSKETLRGDWVVSSDLFRRDAEGYFYYGGRADDLLKVGGIFVAPTEVEAVIMTHSGVLECAVVGFDDDDGLTKAKAVVVCRPGAAASPAAEAAVASEIIALCKHKLVHYKAPKRVEFVAALPRNDRGKIARREVK
jgi:benzoate-CoA ligase family protein